jgi:hypothetical protein
MKRKSVLYAVGLAFALITIMVVLVVVLRYEPAFYRNAEVPAGPNRKLKSVNFVTACIKLKDDSHAKVRWGTDRDDTSGQNPITTEKINSFLAEDPIFEKLVPGMSEPRVVLEEGRVRMGFRYGKRPWSTVVSVDLKVWLVPKDYNAVALEVESVHVGLLPVSVHSVLERMAEAIRQQNRGIEFNWYRHDGHPVALLHFEADRPMPRFRLQEVEIRDGQLIVSGCASEFKSSN